MSEEERDEMASTRFWKSPNTLDSEVPPALAEDPAENVRRIHDIAEPGAPAEPEANAEAEPAGTRSEDEG